MPRWNWIAPLCALLVSCWPAWAGDAGPLTGEDVRWLNRVTYGLDSATVARYQALGRSRFLEEQLQAKAPAPPAEVAEAIAGMAMIQRPVAQVLAELEAEHRRIQAMPEGEPRRQAQQLLNQTANQAAADSARRHLLRALWSPAQVLEQMTWFWLNHFSVFQGKGNLRWTVADYEERAIRPHALGRFRDLLLATLTHPAMLVYLDNAQSAGDRVNENHARELLELHTMGVAGGYSQKDVQELARVLTGVGLDHGREPHLKPAWQALYRHADGFEFNPARHDFGDKVVLGAAIAGSGFLEVEQAVDRILAQPATGRFICRKLAQYWLGGEPSADLVNALAAEFGRSQGDIPALLRVLFRSRPFLDSLGQGFRDPLHFLAASLRLAYDGKHPLNMAPVQRWLAALGEPLYGHVTPEGFPLDAQAWSSPGQMAKRFEIARALGSGNAGLFEVDGAGPARVTGFPLLANRVFYLNLEPLLSPATRQALADAASQPEWNTYLLSSPNFMAR